MIKKIIGFIKRFKSALEDAVTAFKLEAIKEELNEAHETYKQLTARQAAELISDEEKTERALAAWRIYKIGCHLFNGYNVFFKDCAGRLLGKYGGEIIDGRTRRRWLIVNSNDGAALIPYSDGILLNVCEDKDKFSITFTISSFYKS